MKSLEAIQNRFEIVINRLEFTGINFDHYLQLCKVSQSEEELFKHLTAYHSINCEVIDEEELQVFCAMMFEENN